MKEVTLHRTAVTRLSVGLSPLGLCVVLTAIDGSQAAELFLDAEEAEAAAAALAELAAEARRKGCAAVAGRLR